MARLRLRALVGMRVACVALGCVALGCARDAGTGGGGDTSRSSAPDATASGAAGAGARVTDGDDVETATSAEPAATEPESDPSGQSGAADTAPPPDPSAGAAPADAAEDGTDDTGPRALLPATTGAGACSVSDAAVACEARIEAIGTGVSMRDVYYQLPAGEPPPQGFPAVLLFQGSFGGPALTWTELPRDTPLGGYFQGLLQATLLDNGFVVIAPEAEGGLFWYTNASYEGSVDATFMPRLFEEMARGTFGPIDMARLYATGISSGGYMTSRMAVSYQDAPGHFRALAIQSGSYATCLGPLCTMPEVLPADHPPTLFLHGMVDAVVPIDTAERYHALLRDAGIETAMEVDPAAAHEWIEVAPVEITRWFLDH